ncbi:hypothetical protein NE237_012795 [Protea cynaroides]|uniref:Cystatin domain-containing protein n=1 Tax=Protea cynaroides TaxID=273540 RepID=A0A9Q0JYE6_9MAGN|nr:hypothetical protein NE237_012795 [Protea cynaroides]
MALAVMYRSFSSAFLGVSLLLTFVFLFSSSCKMVDAYGMVGGRTEVKDVKSNKNVQDLGRFSVEEYNKNQRHYRQGQERFGERGRVDEPLKFKEVVKAQTQVVSGIKYYLTVSVYQGGIPKTYDAVVVVKPWIKSKQLLNFAPSTN